MVIRIPIYLVDRDLKVHKTKIAILIWKRPRFFVRLANLQRVYASREVPSILCNYIAFSSEKTANDFIKSENSFFEAIQADYRKTNAIAMLLRGVSYQYNDHVAIHKIFNSTSN